MIRHNAQMDRARTFWERLEEASYDVGLPCGLSDIGRELDLWPSAVQKWRDGLGLPGQRNLIELALHRGVNVEWLQTGRGQKLAESAMDAGTRELLKLWQSLDQTARERLLGAARYEGVISAQTPSNGSGEPTKPSNPPTAPSPGIRRR